MREEIERPTNGRVVGHVRARASRNLHGTCLPAGSHAHRADGINREVPPPSFTVPKYRTRRANDQSAPVKAIGENRKRPRAAPRRFVRWRRCPPPSPLSLSSTRRNRYTRLRKAHSLRLGPPVTSSVLSPLPSSSNLRPTLAQTPTPPRKKTEIVGARGVRSAERRRKLVRERGGDKLRDDFFTGSVGRKGNRL